jgi:hypothetical protein
MRSALFKVGIVTTNYLIDQHHTHCSCAAASVSAVADCESLLGSVAGPRDQRIRSERPLWGRFAVWYPSRSTHSLKRRLGQEAAAGFSVCAWVLGRRPRTDVTPDVTPPVLTMLGASAVDNVDGDIPARIVTIITVDTSRAGQRDG